MSLNEGKSGFTLRAGVIASLITVFLVTTSAYIALKVGALPWPIIFSVITSGAILKFLSRFLRKTSIHEMNVAQAGGTIGGLVASGVVFTIPGILYLQKQGRAVSLPNPWVLSLLCIVAGILGVLLSIPVRTLFIDKENLPYPSGTAGAEALKASEQMGKNAFYIMIALTVTGIFVILRNVYLPTGIHIPLLPSIGYSIVFLPMPLAISVGYILGHKSALNSWFLGTAIGWFLIIPLLGLLYNFPTIASSRMVKDLGLGIVLGSGMGYFFSYIVPQAKKLFSSLVENDDTSILIKFFPVFSFFAILALVFVGVSPIAAILTVGGTWIMVTVAGLITGRTNLDPLEQFGILVALFIQGMFALFHSSLDYFQLFLIICFVAIASSVAGDIGHDYKSAKIVKTKAVDIVKVDLLTVIVAGLLIPFVFNTIVKAYREDFFSQVLPAPQAQLVANSISGFNYPEAFYIGFVIAFVWIGLETFLEKETFIVPTSLGIGLFLGPTLGIPVAIGGVISFFVDKKKAALYYPGLLIAVGIMGGESLAEFGSAALSLTGFPYSNWFMAGVLAVFLGFAFVWWKRVKHEKNR